MQWIETCSIHLARNLLVKGFPGGSDCKESACNAGDLGLIPGFGRFLGWRGEQLPTPIF